jgi:hypothetical protein
VTVRVTVCVTVRVIVRVTARVTVFVPPESNKLAAILESGSCPRTPLAGHLPNEKRDRPRD